MLALVPFGALVLLSSVADRAADAHAVRIDAQVLVREGAVDPLQLPRLATLRLEAPERQLVLAIVAELPVDPLVSSPAPRYGLKSTEFYIKFHEMRLLCLANTLFLLVF